MSNQETHTCSTCGYTWRHGQSGSHNCSNGLTVLLEQARARVAELDEERKRHLDELIVTIIERDELRARAEKLEAERDQFGEALAAAVASNKRLMEEREALRAKATMLAKCDAINMLPTEEQERELKEAMGELLGKHAHRPMVAMGSEVTGPADSAPQEPAAQFEQAYRETRCLTFGVALELAKQGRKIARDGWNGRGMWVLMIPESHWETTRGTELCGGLPWLGMKTVDDKFVPWVASQTDLLADDWMVLE